MSDPRQLRNCLGHFATGVTVVTCLADGAPHGATVNSFTAVSLDPPLVLVALDHRTKLRQFLDGNPFTVNVLRERQDELALHFAGRPGTTPVRWAPGSGPPRLADVLAYLVCTPWRSYDGGDHTLYVGKVEEFAHFGGDPLLFYQGRFTGIRHPIDSPWIGSLDSPNTGWLLLEPAN